MDTATIRRIALPILRELAGEAGERLLDPCVRVTWWTFARRRWMTAGGRVRRWLVRLANRRIRALWSKCRKAGGGHCDGEAVARRVIEAATASQASTVEVR